MSDHLHRLQTVYDDRFAREYGPWRPVVAQVAEKFLACGVLDHGFARIRGEDCAHDYLLACSCKCRDFCPSGHAKRLAIWTQWLDTTLLAPVPHRQEEDRETDDQGKAFRENMLGGERYYLLDPDLVTDYERRHA